MLLFAVYAQDEHGNKRLVDGATDLCEAEAEQYIAQIKARQTAQHKIEYYTLYYGPGSKAQVMKSNDIKY